MNPFTLEECSRGGRESGRAHVERYPELHSKERMRELGKRSAESRLRRPVDVVLARQLLRECSFRMVARHLGVSPRTLLRRLRVANGS
jgi:AraC-like DNA-binding protein